MSLLIAVTILFGFFMKVTQFAIAVRKRNRYKSDLRLALARLNLHAKDTALDILVDRYLEPFESTDETRSMQRELGHRALVAAWPEQSSRKTSDSRVGVVVTRGDYDLLRRRTTHRGEHA